jgi:hypothetical protein
MLNRGWAVAYRELRQRLRGPRGRGNRELRALQAFLQLRCLRQVREILPHRWRQTRLRFPLDRVLPMDPMRPVSPADPALLRDREDRQALSVRSFRWLLRGQWGLVGLQVPCLRAYPPGPELPGGPVGQLDP